MIEHDPHDPFTFSDCLPFKTSPLEGLAEIGDGMLDFGLDLGQEIAKVGVETVAKTITEIVAGTHSLVADLFKEGVDLALKG